MLTDEQKRSLLSYLNEFRVSHTVTNNGQEEDAVAFDQKRLSSLPHLREMVKNFIVGRISLSDFKVTSEDYCRKYPYWGFKGFSGQMQLNQYVNNIDDSRKEAILKDCIQAPKDIVDAEKKINVLTQYILELKHSSPNPKSIPRPSLSYLLSYFWEIQMPEEWPVFYSSTHKVLLELGFPLDTYSTKGEEYASYVQIIKEITEFYRTEVRVEEQHPFWFVEHVLWNAFIKEEPVPEILQKTLNKKAGREESTKSAASSADFSWLPPIIQDLEELAYNRPTDWSLKQGLKPEKAFETKLRYAFTLLGFETTELGQGRGREPDGIAISLNTSDHYAIIYDAKAREDRFGVGTSDRAIREYITNKQHELRRLRINRSYFMIISSRFDEGASNINLIKEVYKETRVPVTLVTARDLMFLIESKLQDTSLDHAQMENLLLDTGIVTKEKITETLGR